MERKNKGKYQHQVRKNDREIMSYEEVPLEDYEAEDPKVTKYAVKKILKVFLIIVACCLVVFIFANREKLTYDNIKNWVQYELLGHGTGDGYPVSIVGTNVNQGNFLSIDNYIAYASDTSFVTLSSNAYEIFNTQLSYSKPVIKNSNSKILVYNLDGKGYQINSVDKNLYSGEAPDKIFVADINSSGAYVLVTQSDGYLCKLYAYNNNNKQIYAYSFSEYYITDVALSADGKGAVACGVSTQNGTTVSAIYVLDFSSEKPKSISKIDKNIIYSVKYLSNNSVCAVGSNGSFVLNTSNSQLAKNDYQEKTLTCYDINRDTGCFTVSLSRSGDGRSCDILYFNSEGKLINTISTELKITSISLYKDKIAALSQNTVYVYNRDGKLIYTESAGTDAREVKICSDSSAYILGISEIRQIAFVSKETTANKQ